MKSAAFRRLVHFGKIWRDEATTRCVPVIGTGVSLQAAAQNHSRDALDWRGLMKHIVQKSRVSESFQQNLPFSFIHRWESLLCRCALERRGYQPFFAESQLQRDICEFLTEYELTASSWTLHRKFVRAGFTDIISLNFDRAIALSGDREQFVVEKRRTPIDAASLYRHSVVTIPDGHVRVWYPHGDTRKSKTIKLGVRRYGLYIQHFEAVRKLYMGRWQDAQDSYVHEHPKAWIIPPALWERKVRVAATTWVEVFLSAPLVFIGCSLEQDEWPLWWLLHQRARNTTYLDQNRQHKRPQTLVLRALAPQIQPISGGSAAYIEYLDFRDFGEMWDAVEEALLTS